MKNSKQEIAIQSFHSGLNCAQSIVKAFSKELKLNEEQALFMASGFGAGMGRLQKTCGAVTGSYMLIGLHNNLSSQIQDNSFNLSAKMIQDFESQFITKHGTTTCGELINCDLNSSEGQRKFKEEKIKQNICEKCVSHAVTLLEEILSKEY